MIDDKEKNNGKNIKSAIKSLLYCFIGSIFGMALFKSFTKILNENYGRGASSIFAILFFIALICLGRYIKIKQDKKRQ